MTETRQRILPLLCLPRNYDEPTMIANHSSKWCPHCFMNGFGFVKRRREYTLMGPFCRAEFDSELPVLEPRVSARRTWWNKGIIRWLIAPPDPPTDYPWFASRVRATCPRHGTELVLELQGIRQFGRARLWLFWIRSRIIRTLNWIIPIH